MREELEKALKEVPFTIRMADGQQYRVVSKEQIHFGEKHIVFIDDDVIPHILPLATMTGISYASPVFRQVTKELESLFDKFHPFTIRMKDGTSYTFQNREQLKGSKRVVYHFTDTFPTSINVEDIAEVITKP